MSPSPRNSNPASRPLIKRMDQAAVAALVLLALVAGGLYILARGGATGRLIEIDRARPETAKFQIDINRADWPEFTVLPGVGETLARRIVASRQADGPFADVDALRRVRGIGPKTLEEIRPYLRPVPSDGNVASQ
ncbi:MAG TPA: helix-hairpin-helix domain-containing protein [Pirellulales bacterium]|nr:helix-hairpin-helix domain-containing protein [Pirellulales bacterium]